MMDNFLVRNMSKETFTNLHHFINLIEDRFLQQIFAMLYICTNCTYRYLCKIIMWTSMFCSSFWIKGTTQIACTLLFNILFQNCFKCTLILFCIKVSFYRNKKNSLSSIKSLNNLHNELYRSHIYNAINVKEYPL